jgi:hypothetical protein
VNETERISVGVPYLSESWDQTRHAHWPTNERQNKICTEMKKLYFEKMVHNNFVVLDEICYWLKLIHILISETRCILKTFLQHAQKFLYEKY